jgi:hypothetical protein
MINILQANLVRGYLLIFSTLLLNLTYGQTVLLHETINDYDFKIPKKGPNFRHFNYLNIGYAFFIPSNSSNEIETRAANTTIFTIGWRYKYKIANWIAIGGGINYSNEIFDLKQETGKVVPDSILHSKEKLKFNSLGPDVYIRFNFGKRGNIIGRFIDLGAYAAYAFKVKDMYEDNLEKNLSTGNAGIQKVIRSDLDYVEKIHYGLKVRIGVNRFVLTGTYRLNELLTEDYKKQVGEQTLPQLSIGFEIGLHK